MVSRRWCWTLHGYDDASCAALWDPELRERLRYLVFQEERCPTTGRPHLQGFCILRQPVRTGGLSTELYITGPHAEAARGTDGECAAYCKKQETRLYPEQDFYEPLGELREHGGQGHRSDLDGLRERLRAGATYQEVADEHFGSWLRYERGIRSYRNLRSVKRTWVTRVVVFWGGTGSGKTRRAWQEAGPEAYALPVGEGPQQWFDGYDGEENVIIDDFYGNMRISLFLRLTDRYPLQVQVKGGFVNWAPRTIFITSNLSPDNWWPKAPEEIRAAVQRRLTEVHRMDPPEPAMVVAASSSGHFTYPPEAPLPFPIAPDRDAYWYTGHGEFG